MESLYYGVPVVVFPSIREQVITAERVRDLNLGIVPDRETVTAAVLREAVLTVYKSETIRRSVNEIKDTIRNAGGYLRATEAIIGFQ
jgi:UDP:flavonoid glycosyltransferase YjiC (YdhE family)